MDSYLTQYQAANQSDEQSIRNFIVRKQIFERVIADIRQTDPASSFQHYVFVGRRGSGKSSLLRRIQAEVNTQEDLYKQFEVTNLSEEQAGIYKIHDLWEYVIRDLQSKDYEIDNPDWQEYEDNLKDYTKQLYHNIHKCLRDMGKRLILLVDNIDRIFKNIGTDNALFRELLMNFNDVRIIGGSTIMSDQYWKYDLPFYQYFKIQRLEALTTEEVQQLLDHWSEEKKLPDIKNFLHKYPGKIQSIRMLTDGTPRTMLLFVDMLVNRPVQNGFDYLRHIIDKATPIYQERLAILSPQQQKILVELSFFWEAAPIEALVAKCKMKSKTISAQLNALVKAHIVVKIKGETKNLLYRLEERFFNLWLLMTQGGPRQKRDVKYLTVFLENWYDQTELKNVYAKFVDHLSTKAIRPDYAASMTKALAHSKYLTVKERDAIISKAREIDGMDPRWIAHLPETSKKIYEDAWKLYEKEKYRESIELLKKVEQEDGLKDHRMAMCFGKLGQTTIEEDLYLKAIEKGYSNAVFNIALLYEEQGRIQDAERYYKVAIKNGDDGAMNRLGAMYHDLGRLEEAMVYYKKAVPKNNGNAIFNLATLYANQEKFEEAESLYLKAIEKEIWMALCGLADLYADTEKFEEAEKFYKLAVKKEVWFALHNLANLYLDQNRLLESEVYYKKAIEKEDYDALYNLAVLYQESGKIKEAEFYYKKAIEKEDEYAIYNLAYLYDEQGRLEEAEYYYKRAIEKEISEALYNLAVLYQQQGRVEVAEEYYQQAIEKGDAMAMYNLGILYYEQSIHIDRAIDLIQQCLSKKTDDQDALEIQSILYLWTGKMPDFQIAHKAILEKIGPDMVEKLDRYFIELLIHKQYHLVLKQFENSDKHQAMKEKLKPLWYAALNMANAQDKRLLRMPPEIVGNVEDVLRKVRERQKVYYG